MHTVQKVIKDPNQKLLVQVLNPFKTPFGHHICSPQLRNTFWWNSELLIDTEHYKIYNLVHPCQNSFGKKETQHQMI